MNKLVISAIALRSGGTLSILQDCLKELSHERYADLQIFVILKDQRLFSGYSSNMQWIEIDGTGSYLSRLYYEYWYFRKLSKKINADLWISLHDMTPNVKAGKRVVYCHNPSPFYNLSWQELYIDPKFAMFTCLYRYLYRINIQKNDYVIVQQRWLRERFAAMYHLKKESVIVAHPRSETRAETKVPVGAGITRFIFPTLPRVFKNVEVIGEAVRILNAAQTENFEVIITIDGTENRYARWIKKRYGHLANLKFAGAQPREEIFNLYAAVDALIFPSRLETWGLPISEFKETGKLIILADMPYAHETLGEYANACFFDPASAGDLAKKMEAVIEKRNIGENHREHEVIPAPFASNWHELMTILLRSPQRH